MILIEKLKNRTVIDPITNCWLWQGSKNYLGYGRIGIKGINKYVHREAFRILVKEPENLVLHIQSCPNKNCWNPDHLYDGTYGDNLVDRMMVSGPWLQLDKKERTHCKRGHEFSSQNTRLDIKNNRVCITCTLENSKRQRERLKEFMESRKAARTP